PAPPPAHSDIVRDARASLFRELSAVLPATDTPRGLVVTLPDTSFRNADLDEHAAARLARVAAALASQRGLAVRIEGHMDAPGAAAEDLSYRRAASVRAALLRAGLAPDAINV